MLKKSGLAACLLISSISACTDSGAVDDSDDDTGGDSGLLSSVDLSSLSMEGGCGDVVMYAISEAEDLLLIFSYQGGLTQAAFETAAPASASLDLSAEGSLELWQGLKMKNLVCNDYTEGFEEVHTLWTASSGAASVEVVSDGDDSGSGWGAWPGNATLE